MKKIVIFDLDGTVLDTLRDLFESVNHAMRKNGFPERTLGEVRRFVGNDVRVLIERCVPGGSENPKFEKTLSDFKDHYSVHSADFTKPYDGITELIKKLRGDGYYIAIVSNKFDAAVKKLTDEYFPGLIDVAYGENEENGIRKKPFPDSALKALSDFSLSPEDAVFIGDSEVDFATAKNAGMDIISVLWGFRTREEISAVGQTEFADTPSELYYVIKRK